MNALEGAAVTAASNAASASANNAPANAPVVEAAAVDPALAQQAQQIAALQGISKEIAPRQDSAASDKTKRDLAGFDRALQYAEAALTKGPDIQLGTGAEGSGVGIIVDNQPAAGMIHSTPQPATQPSGQPMGLNLICRNSLLTQTSGGRTEKRDAGDSIAHQAQADLPRPVRRTKVTTMYVRRGVPAGKFALFFPLDYPNLVSSLMSSHPTRVCVSVLI